MKKTSLITLLLIGFLFVLFVGKAKGGAECTGKSDKECGAYKRCVKNMDNEYRCDCQPGFIRKGKNCRDADECQDKKTRMKCKSIGGTCQNTRGSYQCKCAKGYEMHRSKHVCEDYDECDELEKCHVKATCHNTPGSFQCRCIQGFVGDGFECIEDVAYKQRKNMQLIILIGGAAGGGVLLIIALIAFFCCVRKRKKDEEGEKIGTQESTLSQYGQDWESSDSDEDSD